MNSTIVPSADQNGCTQQPGSVSWMSVGMNGGGEGDASGSSGSAVSVDSTSGSAVSGVLVTAGKGVSKAIACTGLWRAWHEVEIKPITAIARMRGITCSN